MKYMSKVLWEWFKRSFIYLVAISTLSICAATMINQNIAIDSLNRRIDDGNTDAANMIESYYHLHMMGDEAIKSDIMDAVEGNYLQANARMDTLDSAIKPDQKRRTLIVNIRNSIIGNTNRKLDIRTLNNIAIAVIDYSYQYNLSIPKILAQIKVESDFNVKAKSKAGAQGLLQIMPKTLDYIELKLGKRLNPWNVYNNILAGCYYMNEQLHDFDNDYDQALRAYNVGPSNLRRFDAGERKTLPEETILYVPSVLRYTREFAKYGLE